MLSVDVFYRINLIQNSYSNPTQNVVYLEKNNHHYEINIDSLLY